MIIQIIIGIIITVIIIWFIAQIVCITINRRKIYPYDKWCQNCNEYIWLEIPIGMTAEEYLKKDKLCPYCVCKHTK